MILPAEVPAFTKPADILIPLHDAAPELLHECSYCIVLNTGGRTVPAFRQIALNMLSKAPDFDQVPLHVAALPPI